LSRFVIGAYDLESGLNPATLSLTLNRAVGPFPAGANLATGITITEGGTATINLPDVLQLAGGDVTATLQIRDMAGHTTRIVRTYKASPTICGSLSSTNQFFAAAGGTGNIIVTAPGSCSWTAASNTEWVVITSSSGGTGNDTVSFEVRENLTASARSATMLIAGRTVTVIQDGGIGDNCLYTIAPASLAFSRGGGSASLTVSCEQRCAWQATSNVGWITITSSGMGIGNGTVSISVAANTIASARAGIITVGGKAIKVKQK
jgi:hypothetical protein